MAAKKVEPAKKPTQTKAPGAQVPATQPKHEVSTHVHDYGNMAGSGFEGTTQEDFAMPFINLLQALSPEVGAEGPDKAIDGAKPGMLINSVTKELYDGKQGILFVPVTTQHVFVEWKPRDAGGGIVGRHEIDSDLVAACKKSSEQFGEYRTDEGHELIETFYMVGYTMESEDATEPQDIVVVPFSSTKIKVYKRIMQMLRTYKGRPPLFANRLRITSTPDKNNKGSFFNFAIAPIHGGVGPSLIPPVLEGQPHPLLVFGQHLGEQVRTGARRMADESVGGTGGGETDAEGKPLF